MTRGRQTFTRAFLAEEIWYSAARRFPWRVVGNPEYPIVLVNKWVRALVAILTRRPNWRGLALRRHGADWLAVQLLRIRRLSPEGKESMNALAYTLRRLNTSGVCIVEDGPDTAYRNKIAVHECVHLFQFRNPVGRETVKAMVKHPFVSKTLPYLAKLGHEVSDAEEVVTELAAYIGSGDHRNIGLDQEEAAEWFSAYQTKCAVPVLHIGTTLTADPHWRWNRGQCKYTRRRRQKPVGSGSDGMQSEDLRSN